MRLAFWREGKDRALAPRVSSKPVPAVAKPVTAPESGDLDLRALGQALIRLRSWVIVPTVLAAVLSMAAVNTVSPRYKSEARILVDGRENIFLRPNGERNEERNSLDAEAVTSQVQLRLSRLDAADTSKIACKSHRWPCANPNVDRSALSPGTAPTSP